jgi:hypothetical protein
MIKTSEMRWAGHVTGMGIREKLVGLFVEKSRRKMPLGGQRRRRVNNIMSWGNNMEWYELDWSVSG